MSCLLSFDDSAGNGVLTGAGISTNGVFELIGYSTTLAGTYGAGGSGMANSYIWGATQDTSGATEGFYKYKYKSTLPPADPCYGEIEFIIPIVQGANGMPADASLTVCSGDPVVDLDSELSIITPAAVNPVTFSISGTLLGVTGYADGGTANDPLDDTFDPSAAGPGNYPVNGVWTVTATPATIPGYTLLPCTNCDAVSSDLTLTVNEAFNPGASSNIAACSDS